MKFLSNPWVLLIVLVVWVASLGAVGYWQREDGKTVERSAWQKRDNDALRLANAKILKLEEEAREKEAKHQLTVATITAASIKELQDVKDQKDRDIAAANRGALRLRYQSPIPINTSGCKVSPPDPTSSGGDGSTTSELPGAVTADLFALANDADAIARRLSFAQQVILEYYTLCGATSH